MVYLLCFVQMLFSFFTTAFRFLFLISHKGLPGDKVIRYPLSFVFYNPFVFAVLGHHSTFASSFVEQCFHVHLQSPY